MDYNEVISLIKLIEESKINTFEINFENTYMNLSKLDNVSVKGSTNTQSVENTTVQSNTVSEVIKEVQKEEVIELPKTIIPKEEKDHGLVITSPIVGTYYESSQSDKPAFVKVGDTVSEGDTLCIVEAMKVMNEVKSKYNGRIAKILLENESTVEYDQPLFIIEEL